MKRFFKLLALKAYWAAKTPRQERWAYWFACKFGLPPSYGKEVISDFWTHCFPMNVCGELLPNYRRLYKDLNCMIEIPYRDDIQPGDHALDGSDRVFKHYCVSGSFINPITEENGLQRMTHAIRGKGLTHFMSLQSINKQKKREHLRFDILAY